MNTEAIARRAYTIWEMAGRPSGKAVEHWLQAEGELAFKLEASPIGMPSASDCHRASAAGVRRPDWRKSASPRQRKLNERLSSASW